MMLVDEGFNLVSVDASDKMLKHALKARWEKRKNPKYDEWGKWKQILTVTKLSTGLGYAGKILMFKINALFIFLNAKFKHYTLQRNTKTDKDLISNVGQSRQVSN